MGQLIVRNLDDTLVDALKVRATAHGRSAEAEHREILRQALAGRPAATVDWLARAAALRAKLRPSSVSTTDLLRADRDR